MVDGIIELLGQRTDMQEGRRVCSMLSYAQRNRFVGLLQKRHGSDGRW